MKIEPTSWHYKLYVFMSQWNAGWRAKDDYHTYPKNKTLIGLCPYMRMILIWGPLSILSNLVPLGFLFGALYLLPAGANGWIGVAWLVFWIVAFIGSLLGLGYLKEWLDKREERKDVKSQLTSPYDEEEKGEGFVKLMYTWVHDSICPILEIQEDGKDDRA